MRKTAESNKGTKLFDCPVEAALDVLGGKWGLPIVARLAPGTQRYSELKRSLPSISADAYQAVAPNGGRKLRSVSTTAEETAG